MSRYPHEVTIICPVGHVNALNTALENAGYGPDNICLELNSRGDTARPSHKCGTGVCDERFLQIVRRFSQSHAGIRIRRDGRGKRVKLDTELANARLRRRGKAERRR